MFGVKAMPNLDGEEGFGSGKGVEGERLIRRQGSGKVGKKMNGWVWLLVASFPRTQWVQ